MLSLFTHPGWSIPALFHSSFRMANFETVAGETSATPAERVNRLFDRSVTWSDAEWLVSRWDGPVIIKGLNAVDDARRAVAIGARAAMISNHGGRQLDEVVAPIRQLPRIRDAIGDGLELIVDGGIRRGRDIAKALALGADACSIGRAYLYGLAAFGEAGVAQAIAILRTEFERTMALLGCATIGAIRPEHVVRRN
jgi:L-lactate dehydrogenase (cytochrome)